MQKSVTFMNAPINKIQSRDALNQIFKNETFTVSTDGYRVHIEYLNNHYKLGLTPSRKAIKRNASITSKYPDIMQFIQRSFVADTEFAVNPKELHQAVKIAMIFSKNNANSVRFRFADNTLYVRGICGDTSNEVETAVSVEGTAITTQDSILPTFLNGKYVMEALAGMKHGKRVVVRLSRCNPNTFTLANERKALIMPMSK